MTSRPLWAIVVGQVLYQVPQLQRPPGLLIVKEINCLFPFIWKMLGGGNQDIVRARHRVSIRRAINDCLQGIISAIGHGLFLLQL